jgi:hypothetical protein
MNWRAIWLWLALLLVNLGFARTMLGVPQSASHSVTLIWSAAAQSAHEAVATWNVYRSTAAGGPYALLASVPVETVNYLDSAVVAGNKYFYVVTAVDTAGAESVYSASRSATIPAAGVPLSVTTTTLPTATVNVAYTAMLSAAGGNSPYTWTGSGVPGLTVTSAGLVSGAATQSGTFNEAVIVTDLTGRTARTSIPINVTTVAGPPPPPPTGSLPDGLTLHWTFDKADILNGIVADRSGNGNMGTIFGNLQSVAGKLNQALSFGGSTSYVSANPSAGALTHSLTLAAWINTTNASRTEAIFSNFNAAGSGAGFIFTTNRGGNLAVRLGGADISAYPNLVTDSSAINDGKWHHVVTTISFELQMIKFYVDGNLTSSAATHMVPNGQGGATLQIGVNPWTAYGDFFDGAIDEVQVYNRALVNSEVNKVYQLSGGLSK